MTISAPDDTHVPTPDADLPAPEAGEQDAIAGSRFISKYESRAHLHRLHPVRLWRLVVGLGLLIFGIINIFIPGPGGSVIILASLLVLAGESKLLAKLLDYLEVKFSRQIGWALEHKILAMLIISGTAFACVSGLTYLIASR